MANYKKTQMRNRSVIKPKRRVAKPTKAIVRYVNRALERKLERKTRYVELNEVAMNTVTQLYAYDPIEIAQGITTGERIGTEISLKGIHVKGFMRNNAIETVYVRMVLLKSQYDSNITAASTIFQDNVGGEVGLASGLNCLYQPFYRGKIQPIWTRMIKLAPSTSTDGNEVRFLNKFVKLDQKIKFSSSSFGAGLTKPRYHLLFILADAADDTGLGSTVESSFTMRTWYTDA